MNFGLIQLIWVTESNGVGKNAGFLGPKCGQMFQVKGLRSNQMSSDSSDQTFGYLVYTGGYTLLPAKIQITTSHCKDPRH